MRGAYRNGGEWKGPHMTESVERAAQLGTEHGTRAAEEFLDYHLTGRVDAVSRSRRILAAIDSGLAKAAGEAGWVGWPEPRLDEDATWHLLQEIAGATTELGHGFAAQTIPPDSILKYKTAFTAAVEATIRTKCEEVR